MRAWRELPPGPLQGYFYPAAAWTGNEVLVISDVPTVSGPPPWTTVESATLDPVTGQWRQRAPVPLDHSRPGRETLLQHTDGGIVLTGGSGAAVPNRAGGRTPQDGPDATTTYGWILTF